MTTSTLRPQSAMPLVRWVLRLSVLIPAWGAYVGVQIEKVQDMAAIIGYGVMATPGVVVDGKVVHAGGVPSRDKIRAWFA